MLLEKRRPIVVPDQVVSASKLRPEIGLISPDFLDGVGGPGVLIQQRNTTSQTAHRPSKNVVLKATM